MFKTYNDNLIAADVLNVLVLIVCRVQKTIAFSIWWFALWPVCPSRQTKRAVPSSLPKNKRDSRRLCWQPFQTVSSRGLVWPLVQWVSEDWFPSSNGPLPLCAFIQTAGCEHRPGRRLPWLCATQAGRGSVKSGAEKEEGNSLGVRIRQPPPPPSSSPVLGRVLPSLSALACNTLESRWSLHFKQKRRRKKRPVSCAVLLVVAGSRRNSAGKPKATWASCDKGLEGRRRRMGRALDFIWK